jgi:hypothetical protein
MLSEVQVGALNYGGKVQLSKGLVPLRHANSWISLKLFWNGSKTAESAYKSLAA